MAGNAKAQAAMTAARANEVNQQAGLQQQSNAIFQKSLAGSTPATAAQQMQEGQAQRNNAWQALQTASAPVASALPATSDPNSPTAQAKARAGTAANAWNTLNANAAAKEGSYGDWQNQQAIKNANAAQQLGVINNFSAGDASLLPTELQVASQAGDKLSGWGSVVGMLGNLTSLASKAGTFGTPSPAVPQGAASWANPTGSAPVVDNTSGTPNWANLYQ
jgi:hypothetical protein